MGSFQNLGYQLLLIIVVPCLVPLGLIGYKVLLDKREAKRFSFRLTEWHEDCNRDRDESIRGMKAKLVFHNCAAAILMAIPFSLITSTHQIFEGYWKAAGICLIVVLIFGFMYFVIRDLLIDIDFNIYRYNMSVAPGIGVIIWGTTIISWIFCCGIFYVIIMEKVMFK